MHCWAIVFYHMYVICEELHLEMSYEVLMHISTMNTQSLQVVGKAHASKSNCMILVQLLVQGCDVHIDLNIDGNRSFVA